MSWICDYCSTANEDRDTECFVCCRERSKESIRAAKRAAREERTKRINEAIYKGITITGKVMFFSSIVLFSVIALIPTHSLNLSEIAPDDVTWKFQEVSVPKIDWIFV